MSIVLTNYIYFKNLFFYKYKKPSINFYKFRSQNKKHRHFLIDFYFFLLFLSKLVLFFLIVSEVSFLKYY